MSSSAPDRSQPTDRARWFVPAALIVAVTMTLTITVMGSAPGRAATERSQEFQLMLGGLGTAPATSLSGGPHSLDARLGRTPFERDGTMRAAATWEPGGAIRLD